MNSILDGSYAGILPSEDRSGHGTQVAAIAAGTNIGVAPQTELLVVKIGSDTASKLPTTLGLILGIDYAIRTGMEIITAPIKVILCLKIISTMCPDLLSAQYRREQEMMRSTEGISV